MEKARTIALWALATLLIVVSVRDDDTPIAGAALLVGLAGLTSAICWRLDVYVHLLVRVLALYSHDKPIDDELGESATHLLSGD
jgi:hypothetical protein